MPGWSHCSMWPEPTRSLRSASGPASPSASSAARACDGLVCGVDHSEVMLRQARRRNADAIAPAGRPTAATARLPPELRRSVRQGCWPSTRWASGRTREACLRTVRSLLRPGGRIAIALPATMPRLPPRRTSREAGQAIATCLVEAVSPTPGSRPCPSSRPSCACWRPTRGHSACTGIRRPAVACRPEQAASGGPARRPRRRGDRFRGRLAQHHELVDAGLGQPGHVTGSAAADGRGTVSSLNSRHAGGTARAT